LTCCVGRNTATKQRYGPYKYNQWHVQCARMAPCYPAQSKLHCAWSHLEQQLTECHVTNTKVYFHYHNIQTVDPILCQCDPVHIFPNYFFKIISKFSSHLQSFLFLCVKEMKAPGSTHNCFLNNLIETTNNKQKLIFVTSSMDWSLCMVHYLSMYEKQRECISVCMHTVNFFLLIFCQNMTF
jgi:hypothetical protein